MGPDDGFESSQISNQPPLPHTPVARLPHNLLIDGQMPTCPRFTQAVHLRAMPLWQSIGKGFGRSGWVAR